MRLDAVFRLSTYLTLATACLCLSYAEEPFLPGNLVVGTVMGIALVGAFLAEGRWALSRAAANVVGLCIAAGAVLWLAYHGLHTLDKGGETSSQPAAVLPYLGPIVMVLLLAKLFRPKQIHDYWLIHSLGLLEVILACVLASQPLFGVFLAVYLGCGLWALSVFHHYREQASIHGNIGGAKRLPATTRGTGWPPVPWRFLGTLQAARRLLVVLVLGVVVFLLTPQHGAIRWDPRKLTSVKTQDAAKTGYSRAIDLNLGLPLQPDDEVAIEVYAEEADGRPKLDLDPDQHWRGTTVDFYQRGRWRNRFFPEFGFTGQAFDSSAPDAIRLPDLGLKQYFLTFTLDPRNVHRMFVADPVVYPPDKRIVPVIFLGTATAERQPTQPQLFQQDDLFLPPPKLDHGKYHYKQVTRPLAGPPASQPLGPPHLYEEHFVQQPVLRIRSWTWELLQLLVQKGSLAVKDVKTVSEHRLRPENWAKVARALSDYLASSGEYNYTLSVSRLDPNLDPTEEFLCYSRNGHCEQFAAGLALMLRSCGIPARVVLGFRGAESQGDGHYLVRQSHSHTWVEAYVPLRGPAGRRQWRWLTLDPTSATEVTTPIASSRGWWHQAETTVQSLWQTFVLDYDTEQQSEVVTSLWRRLVLDRSWPGNREHGAADQKEGGVWLPFGLWLLMGIAGVVVLVGVRRHWLRPSGQTTVARPSIAFYARLLAVLARHCRLIPEHWQTPREFGETAVVALKNQTADQALANVPLQVVALFYRVRYGGLPLTSAEQRDVDRRIFEMEAALSKHRENER